MPFISFLLEQSLTNDLNYRLLVTVVENKYCTEKDYV